MSVIDIRVRAQKPRKHFNYSATAFPDASEIVLDQIAEQMMMDGLVTCDILIKKPAYFTSVGIYNLAWLDDSGSLMYDFPPGPLFSISIYKLPSL